MKAIVVSDLHMGSRYFLHHHFEGFLRDLPEDCELVLNGDIIESPHARLAAPHQRILEVLRQHSYHRSVIWLRGNHDDGYRMERPGEIRFRPFHAIGRRLLIMHGHDFDEIMPRARPFMKAFKLMHALRLRLGARPVHVAEYAKRWERLYRFFRQNIRVNAVKCARERGYEAISCGHTHFAEDVLLDGIRYVNTGAWTETPMFYLLVTDQEITLKAMDFMDLHHPRGNPGGRNKTVKLACYLIL